MTNYHEDNTLAVVENNPILVDLPTSNRGNPWPVAGQAPGLPRIRHASSRLVTLRSYSFFVKYPRCLSFTRFCQVFKCHTQNLFPEAPLSFLPTAPLSSPSLIKVIFKLPSSRAPQQTTPLTLLKPRAWRRPQQGFSPDNSSRCSPTKISRALVAGSSTTTS